MIATVMHTSTAELVTELLQLFAPSAETILDATYGSGLFWRRGNVPSSWAHCVVGLDRNPVRARNVAGDYTALPFRDEAFDVVCFDPPHLCDGGAASIMRDRYGTFGSEHELKQSIRQGLRECSRVARSLVIAKLANYVHAQRPFRLTRWAEDELGDAFEIILERRSPTGTDPKWGAQRTPRCVDSRFLVWTI